MCVYPKGNKKAKGTDHISLYLQIVDTEKFPGGWEIHTKFCLFVYDHFNDKYLAFQDAGSKTRRFNCVKTEWGFDKLLPLSTFNDPSKGYLVDDTCAFGAEILAVSIATKHEFLSMVKEPMGRSYTWTVKNFAAQKRNQSISSEFIVEGRKWKLQIYPCGDPLKSKGPKFVPFPGFG
ncbi:unnamed protein product [Cuscuta europaea]|uniref:MATH domain-containing protein n=1 Tax=Cuscuta europaea TaxID=41803 RepID=A0A9P0YJE4_CUSEU|nr:unnamed protein product [Cuscuta europaea]